MPDYWITEKPNGYLYVYFKHLGKWQSAHTKERDEAVRYAENVMHARGGSAQSLGSFARDFFIPGKCSWLAAREARGRPLIPSGVYRYRYILKRYVLPRWEHVPISQITSGELDDWLVQLRTVKGDTAPSGTLRNRIRTVLRVIFTEADRRNMLVRNPVDRVGRFVENPKERQIFTPKEMEKLFPVDREKAIEVWLTQGWYLYFYILATTGRRPGEVSALRWGDEQTSGVWILRRRWSNTDKLFLDATKSGEVNSILLNKRAQEEMAVYQMEHPGRQPSELVFSVNGGPIVLETSGKHFRESAKRAKVELAGRTTYCLRHTAYTDFRRLMPEALARLLIGHERPETGRVYNHPTDAMLVEQILKAREYLEQRGV